MQFEEEIFFRKIAKEGLLTLEQVEECLEIQRKKEKSSSLFVIMIEKGYINNKNMAEILKRAPIESPRDGEDKIKKPTKKFGELCIEKGFATPEQVAECLALQERLKKEGKHFRIGQILVEKKYVAARQAQLILELQGKKIVKCKKCERKYNIKRYNPKKRYECPKCGGELVPAEALSSVEVKNTYISEKSTDIDDEALALLHKKIEDYEIVELIGQGGMAYVYKVVSTKRKKVRALKVMKAQAGLERFTREFESAHALRHPNIVRVYKTGKIDNRPYFFMEYLDGGNLEKMIEKYGVIPLKEALSILKQVTLGLKYAHESKIVHRDIKPSNIMLTKGSNREIIAKITDFGIARAPDSHITVTGQLVGTLKYMSPEQIKGKSIDGRADIFSLGIVAFEMFTGREPFKVDNSVGYLYVNIRETPPLIHTINPDLPKPLSLIINKMLAKDLNERYDASSLLRDIDRFIKYRETGKEEILYNTDDPTSVFYSKSKFYGLKLLFDKIFSKPSPEITTIKEENKIISSNEWKEKIRCGETEATKKDTVAQQQYEFALNLIKKKDIQGAIKNLEAVIEVFPGTLWAHKAQKKLNKLQTLLSLKEKKKEEERLPEKSSSEKKNLEKSSEDKKKILKPLP